MERTGIQKAPLLAPSLPPSYFVRIKPRYTLVVDKLAKKEHLLKRRDYRLHSARSKKWR